MAIAICEFYKDRYLGDVNRTGLIYDLYTLPRGSGDQGALNVRIAEANSYLELSAPGGSGKCTLLLNPNQVEGLTDHWRQIFAPKTQLMLFRPGADVGEIVIKPWDDYHNDGFVWSSADRVFTQYDSNELSARFRIVDQEEVDNYLSDQEPNEPPVVPPVVSSIPKKWKISLLGGLINGTIEAIE